jgi:hypothetical protein
MNDLPSCNLEIVVIALSYFSLDSEPLLPLCVTFDALDVSSREHTRQPMGQRDSEDEEDRSYRQCGNQHGSLGYTQRIQDWKPLIDLRGNGV